ncbi:Dyp-type peroxidase domain-containing protein [Saccharopolyspora pogona]|uniref:Dyp-type peroxidase domain-containing protein n=1 Tax=Saccharopolyspora pogona TaxID=333966 RepID=UPI0037C9E2F0
MGIGAAAWDRLYSGPRPAGPHALPEFVGPRHRSVSTPGDLLLLHIRARPGPLPVRPGLVVVARPGRHHRQVRRRHRGHRELIAAFAHLNRAESMRCQVVLSVDRLIFAATSADTADSAAGYRRSGQGRYQD